MSNKGSKIKLPSEKDEGKGHFWKVPDEEEVGGGAVRFVRERTVGVLPSKLYLLCQIKYVSYGSTSFIGHTIKLIELHFYKRNTSSTYEKYGIP